MNNSKQICDSFQFFNLCIIFNKDIFSIQISDVTKTEYKIVFLMDYSFFNNLKESLICSLYIWNVFAEQ
jgi:hypothetical protein